MTIRKSQIIIIGIILLSFVIGIYFYPQMPEKVASHWNAQGQVDGYMSKFWGLFLMPLISIGLLFLFIILPRIDPQKANIEKFRKYFDRFIILVFIFLFYLYLLTILWNVGMKFSMTQFLAPAFGVLFYYCGVLIEKAKRNFFIGIRTPWTLSNDKVWDKTHAVGGKLFKLVGVIALFGVFLPDYAIWLMLVPVIIVSLVIVVYSYFQYRMETKS